MIFPYFLLTAVTFFVVVFAFDAASAWITGTQHTSTKHKILIKRNFLPLFFCHASLSPLLFRLYVIGFMVLLYYGKLECTGFFLMLGHFFDGGSVRLCMGAGVGI